MALQRKRLRYNKDDYVSAGMRDLLMEHVDGVFVPIIQPTSIIDSDERDRACQIQKSLTALVNRGFVRPAKPSGRPTKVFRPTHTVITEAGRAALRRVLADYANTLVRAGWRVEELRYNATLGGALVNEPSGVLADRPQAQTAIEVTCTK